MSKVHFLESIEDQSVSNVLGELALYNCMYLVQSDSILTPRRRRCRASPPPPRPTSPFTPVLLVHFLEYRPNALRKGGTTPSLLPP